TISTTAERAPGVERVGPCRGLTGCGIRARTADRKAGDTAEAPIRLAAPRRLGHAPAMAIRAIHYDANGHDREIDLASEALPRVDKNRVLWVDVDGRDAGELRDVAGAIGLEPEALRRLAREDRRARILRLP